MFGLIKKVFIKKSKKKEDNPDSWKNKFTRLYSHIKNNLSEFFSDLLLMREKMKNLRQTNVDLGKKHIEKGNISDAIFRFKFTKFFWPDCYESYYYLAYCYALKKKNKQAEIILRELIVKEPRSQKAKELLMKVTSEK